MKTPTRAGILLQKMGQPSENQLTYILHHFVTADADARDFVRCYLVEGGRTFDLGQGRSVMFHRGHVPNSQDEASDQRELIPPNLLIAALNKVSMLKS